MRNKILVSVVFGIILFIVVISRFYQSVQGEEWSAEQQAVKKAKSQTPVVSVDRVDPFTWDESYYVIFGKDAKKKELIVWIQDNGSKVETRYASDGVSREQTKNIFQAKQQGSSILRMTPGILSGAPVWEVFYTKLTGTEKRYFYDFYQFKDGKFIVTYKLSER